MQGYIEFKCQTKDGQSLVFGAELYPMKNIFNIASKENFNTQSFDSIKEILQEVSRNFDTEEKNKVKNIFNNIRIFIEHNVISSFNVSVSAQDNSSINLDILKHKEKINELYSYFCENLLTNIKAAAKSYVVTIVSFLVAVLSFSGLKTHYNIDEPTIFMTITILGHMVYLLSAPVLIIFIAIAGKNFKSKIAKSLTTLIQEQKNLLVSTTLVGITFDTFLLPLGIIEHNFLYVLIYIVATISFQKSMKEYIP